MSNIIASIHPNNQVDIKVLDTFARKSIADLSPQRELEFVANSVADSEFWQLGVFNLSVVDKFLARDPRTGETRQCVGVYEGRTGGTVPIPVQQYSDMLSDAREQVGYHWVAHCLDSVKQLFEFCKVLVDIDILSLLLDILQKSQQIIKSHKQWGQLPRFKRFSKRGRLAILRAGGAIDKAGLGDSCHMVTLTVPGGGDDVAETISRYSGYIMNRLSQVLRRERADVSYKQHVGHFYVWELQKRGVLHLHWCLVGYEAFQAHLLKDKWYEVLSELSVKTGINLFLSESGQCWQSLPDVWQWDIQKVQKSVAGYFAKYCSKSALATASDEEEWDDETRFLCPGCWYGISQSIRELVKHATVEIRIDGLTREQATAYADRLRALIASEDIAYSKFWDIAIYTEYGLSVCTGYRYTYLVKPSSYARLYQSFYQFRLAIGLSKQSGRGIRMPCVQSVSFSSVGTAVFASANASDSA